MAAQWLSTFGAAEQLGQEIMELINERNTLQRTGSNSSKVQSIIRIKLNEFAQIVKSLQNQLLKATSTNTIAQREMDRRQNQIDSLLSKEKQLNQAFKPTSNYKDNVRSDLFDDDGFGAYTSAGSSRPNDTEITVESFTQQQQTVMADQDRGLEELSKVITRQKMMGQTIGDELDYHNELIDDITQGVDKTTSKLQRTTAHTKKVTKKASTCCMMVVIIFLLLLIVTFACLPSNIFG